MSRFKSVALLTMALGLTVGTGTAGAAQRYVAPAGGGSTCSQALPCSIVTGVNSANMGDEVIVASGTYTTSTAMSNGNNNLSVHGVAGQPRPVVNSSAGIAFSLNGNNGTVRDLTINHSGASFALFTGFGTVVDHVDVRSAGAACVPIGSTIRDSICAATTNAVAGVYLSVGGGTVDIRLRNVTAIGGSPGGSAMSITGAAAGSIVSVDSRNVIFQGHGAGADLVATTAAVGASVTLTQQNSMYDSFNTSGPGTETVTPLGSATNLSTQPLFASTATYEQAADSPTIDAGATDAFTGTTTDLNGEPRVQGAAIDIGADEFASPIDPPVDPPPADTTPPETKIDKGPKKKGKSKKATFKFSSDDPAATFSCALDKKPAAPCTSPLKLKRLKKGKHKLSVVATDAAGNADATPATHKWKVKKKRKKR